MAEPAAEFLRDWRQSNIYAEARTIDELDEIVAECRDDAAEAGYSSEDLAKAAGGNLKEYIRAAIIEVSSE